ncbi:hypothetical protein BJ912DRAFT_1023781 [Pholiota molesta]|nr:hypothetical protein BJ912DRAFT_1023781 [Pholiota molesta]
MEPPNIRTATPAVELAKAVVECRYNDALRSETARRVFRPLSGDLERPFDEIFDLSIHQEGDALEEELEHLVLAIACLHAFVQANWTGPDLELEPLELFANGSEASSSWTAEAIHAKAVSELAYGGEPAYHLAKVPAFLRLAQLLLRCPPWWRLRVATVHQQILDDPVSLPDDFRALLQPLTSTFASEPDLAGRLNLEIGLLEHVLSQDKTAGEDFVKASRSTGLEYELTGALGKGPNSSRTSSDPNDGVTQKETKPSIVDGATDTTNVPETLALNDDTLLEQTEFTSPTAPPPLDQCILLSLCLNVRNTQPSHGLTAEQMSPYVSRVISHPRNWSVHTMALLLRSRLESSRTRTVERSTLQLQALIDQMPTADSSTRWDMEKELAQRFLSLGVVKSALEIFERLEMWEDVVKCYGALEKPEKGIAIVKDLLEGRKEEADAVISRAKTTSLPRKKTQDATREAKLWCLLGDLDPTNAEEHYQRAWQLSNETSGRAMRSLGGYYFARAKFAEAIECLKRAVKINPLQTRSWFILGCACMRVEKWEDAKNAFTRCVAIDEEDGESWNNLAKGLSSNTVPFENKMLAFRALKQGLRYSYENWRMWYNYMIVAMDMASAMDEDVLDRLVDAVTRANPDAEAAAADESGAAQNPNEGHGLFRNVLGLLERTLLPRMSSPRVFRAYARLLSWRGRWEDALKAYLDAYRAGVAGTMEKGETDVEKWREAVIEVEEIVDILRNFGPRVDGYKWRLQARSIDEPEWARLVDLQDELRKEDD